MAIDESGDAEKRAVMAQIAGGPNVTTRTPMFKLEAAIARVIAEARQEGLNPEQIKGAVSRGVDKAFRVSKDTSPY